MNWYLRAGLKPRGPFTEDDIRGRLSAGEVSPEDLLWKDGDNEWKAAFLWREFRAMSVPAFQEVERVGEDEKEWVVLEREAGASKTSGPWSLAEIRTAIKEGRLKGTDHLWKKGMTGWARIESRPERLAEPSISEDPEIPSQP